MWFLPAFKQIHILFSELLIFMFNHLNANHYGNVIVEAILLEKPIVSTYTYGAGGIDWEDGKNGLLCGFDPCQIAESVMKMINDDELCIRLSQGEQRINRSKIGNELNSYYELFSV